MNITKSRMQLSPDDEDDDEDEEGYEYHNASSFMSFNSLLSFCLWHNSKKSEEDGRDDDDLNW